MTGVRVTDAEANTETVEATSIQEIPSDTYDGATRIRPLGEGVDAREFAVPTGGEERGTFADVPAGTRVLYAVGPTGNPVSSTGFAQCDTVALTEVRIDLLQDNISSQSTVCSD